jgi:hypothetical protein
VSIIDRARVSSEEVWGYPTRTLTERFAIIERVAPRYDSAPALLLRSRRFITAGTRFIGFSSDTLLLFDDDQDLVRKATETILASDFNPAGMKDSDDATRSSISIPPSAIVNIVKYDLGAVADISIVFVVGSSSPANYCRLLTSSDDVTYTEIVNHNGAVTTFMRVVTARYILLRGANTSNTTAYLCYFHTLEAYPWSPDSTRVDRTYTSTVLKTLTVIGRGYSYLWEVVQL